MYDDTSIGVTSVAQEGVTPSVVDMTVVMEKQSSFKDTIGLGSFLPLPTHVNTSAGNSPGNDDGLSAIATKLHTPLMLDSYTSDMCMQSWGRSSYARVMIELRADVELKDNIVLAMPRIKGGIIFVMSVLSMSEKPLGFKPQKEYRPISKKPTASFNGNKKKGVEPTIEVSNSNSFDVLNSVDNDVEFGTNCGLLIW
nr:hypothetical protein [Tanacetum cinerariifolium]